MTLAAAEEAEKLRGELALARAIIEREGNRNDELNRLRAALREMVEVGHDPNMLAPEGDPRWDEWTARNAAAWNAARALTGEK